MILRDAGQAATPESTRYQNLSNQDTRPDCTNKDKGTSMKY